MEIFRDGLLLFQVSFFTSCGEMWRFQRVGGPVWECTTCFPCIFFISCEAVGNGWMNNERGR